MPAGAEDRPEDPRWDPLADPPDAPAEPPAAQPKPPAPPPARPAPPPRPARAPDARADAQVQARIKAYPGTLTFHDLIRRNKRASAWLIILMILLGTLVGAIIGGAVGPAYRGARQGWDDYSSTLSTTLDPEGSGPTPEQEQRMDTAPARMLGLDASVYRDLKLLLPSIGLGALAAAMAVIFAAIWSYTSGASAILRMARATRIGPQDDPELYNVVDEMRIAAGLPMPEVYLIGDSAMNAFATGRDPAHSAIAITSGLRKQLTRDELQGVIAHEMAHIRHYDIRFSMLMATLVGLIVFACDAFLRVQFYGGRGRRSGGGGGGKGSAAGLILVLIGLLLAILAPIAARIIQMAYSRQREYLADAGAVELTRNPEGLASALSRLAMDDEPLVDAANRGTAHMYVVNPMRKMRTSHQSLNSVFSSHPPIKDRIARILALAR